MAIRVKAIERNVSFEKGQEKFAYVLQADLYSKLSDTKVIQEAALRSGIKKNLKTQELKNLIMISVLLPYRKSINCIKFQIFIVL